MRVLDVFVFAFLAPAAFAASKEFKGGHVFLASYATDTVCEFTAEGIFVKSHAIGSTQVTDVDFGADGLMYVPKASDLSSTARIRAFRADGAILRDLPVNGTPVSVKIGPGGRVYVADYDHDRVDVIGATDTIEATYDSGTMGPLGLAFTPRGTLAVACETANLVRFLDPLDVSVGVSGIAQPKRITMLGNGAFYVSNQSGDLAFFDRYGTALPGENINKPFGATIFDAAIQGDFEPMLVLPTQNVALDVGSTLVSFGAPELAQPMGIAIAPYRFKASISGTLATLGGNAKSVKQSAVLSVLPGSNRVMVSFSKKSKLGKAFLAQAFVCHGLEDDGAFAGYRAIHATQRVDASLLFADASIDLRIVEKTPTATHAFTGVKSAKGTLHASTSFATFIGSIKTSKHLN